MSFEDIATTATALCMTHHCSIYARRQDKECFRFYHDYVSGGHCSFPTVLFPEKFLVLILSGYHDVENSEYIDSVNSLVRQSLQKYILSVHPTNKMRYSQLLLTLPALFGINCKMMENLFCRHIIGDADMEVLLKEMLQKI